MLQATSSLTQRAKELSRQGFKCSAYRLRKFYRDKGVRFKLVKDKHRWRRNETADTTRKDEQMLKALKEVISNAVKNNKHIVYADECLFNQKVV